MKLRGSKFGGGSRKKLGLPWILLLCLSCFLGGFSGSYFFSHQEVPGPPRRSMEEEMVEFEPQPSGDSGQEAFVEIPFQILSRKPRAVYFPNFATAEQCQSIIQMAKLHLMPSSLALREGETAETTQGIRTSSGTFISSSDDKTGILDQIEIKIAEATMIPKNHGEAFNVLRYEIGQSYHSHYDSFNPAEYGPQKSQRLASFLLYLSDVQEGGETMFPFENGQNMNSNYNFRECVGLKVKPRRGDGLLFYSLLPNGTIDLASLHGSCPVIKGEKWVATKWIRNQGRDEDY